MITGAHVIVYSANVEADRAFLLEMLGTRSVDAGGGWLILALPPAEIAVHPSDETPRHELYMMCDDIEDTMIDLATKGARFEGGVSNEGWGRLATIRLPGGGLLGVYQPLHPVAADIYPPGVGTSTSSRADRSVVQ